MMTEDLKIIDNYIDDREFRNYVSAVLEKKGFKNISIDDARVADEDTVNDNDMMAELDGVKYTIQTFLNTEITVKEVNETLKDIEDEKVGGGILVTNEYVKGDVLEYALEEGIEIWDRNFFEKEEA